MVWKIREHLLHAKRENSFKVDELIWSIISLNVHCIYVTIIRFTDRADRIGVFKDFSQVIIQWTIYILRHSGTQCMSCVRFLRVSSGRANCHWLVYFIALCCYSWPLEIIIATKKVLVSLTTITTNKKKTSLMRRVRFSHRIYSWGAIFPSACRICTALLRFQGQGLPTRSSATVLSPVIFLGSLFVLPKTFSALVCISGVDKLVPIVVPQPQPTAHTNTVRFDDAHHAHIYFGLLCWHCILWGAWHLCSPGYTPMGNWAWTLRRNNL